MENPKTLICDVCHKEFTGNTEYLRSKFARYNSKELGYGFHSTCKECEEKILREKEWKDGNLLCHICNQYLDPSEFSIHPHYIYRDNHECRCRQCKTKQNKIARKKYSQKLKLLKILQMRFLGARDRAKKYNLEFNITKKILKRIMG